MKVGILTYHRVSNFGANLQAFSTVSYFKNRGDDVVIIDWYPKELDNYYIKSVCEKQRIVHQSFVEKFLPVTKHCETSKDVKDIVDKENFDLIVIGSDAVFSYIPFLKRIHPSRKTLIGISQTTPDHKIPNPFWADFADGAHNVKIASLSASAQYLDIDKCTWWNRKQLKKLLSNFDMLNVRDRWTQRILSEFTDKEITITPDPVFGFNINVREQVSESEIRKKYNLPEKYALISFCSKLFPDSWYKQLYEGLKKNGYEVINFAMPEGCIDIYADRKIDVPLPPMDWYAIIKYSQAYIGQRMHPMIVAFSNIVPFFVFDHYAYKKGKSQLDSSKIYDLLERGGMLSCYYNIKSVNKELTADDVVNNILNFDKDAAQTFVEEYKAKYINMMNSIVSLV